ncbi:MAG: hypothetical protein LBF55_00115 [Prevotellaceae bacterium]|jgi:hypothetical protein|nr:hypothetical protein [Prevotellaceae bacterium]
MSTALQTPKKAKVEVRKPTKTLVQSTNVEETKPYCSWEEIRKKYPNHWILIENPVFDSDGSAIKKGIVLCTSTKRDDISNEIKKRENLYYAVEYTGQRKKRVFL